MRMLLALLSYRGFVFGSVRREFQLRYRNSLLGAAWTVLNPLAMILVYTLIFSQVMQAKLPGVSHGFAYSIYLCSGLLTWGLFAEIVARGQNIFLENANLLKKISFPRMTLPVIAVLNAVLNFSIICFATGLGVVLGVLNVFFRDVGQFFGIFLQFWFWLTPIVYPSAILPDQIKPLLTLNPMYALIESYQLIFVQKMPPDWISLIYPLASGVLLCGLGLRLYRQHVGEMVDEL